MSDEIIIKEYRYGLSRRTTFWMMVFMAVGTPAMVWFAFFLPPAEYESEDGGGWFILRAVACIAPISTGIMAWAYSTTFTHRLRIALTPTTLICPKPSRWNLSREEIRVPYSEFHQVEELPFVGNARMIQIRTGNQKIQIASNMIENRKTYDELASWLQEAYRQRALSQDG
jgi:hypothetical protein